MQQQEIPRARRRWDDRPGALPAMTFARYLTTSPDIPEIMRFLVGLLSWPVGAYGAYLICPHTEDINVCARFEQPIDGTARIRPSTDVEAELAEAVRATSGGQPVMWTSPHELYRTPLAAWPLGVGVDSTRVLALLLAEPMDPESFAERTIGLAEALGVYLAGSTAVLTLPRFTPTPPDGEVHLSERQFRILALMDDGLTMGQIAGRIGYSESTVRMESLAIYRQLGVHDRAQALTVAQELRIFPSQPDTSN